MVRTSELWDYPRNKSLSNLFSSSYSFDSTSMSIFFLLSCLVPTGWQWIQSAVKQHLIYPSFSCQRALNCIINWKLGMGH
jgi:hypothetical protein